MASEPAPAIRTAIDERYSDMQLITKVGSDTRFERGLGQIGTVVELVDMSFMDGCPRCGETEMVLSKDLGPVSAQGEWYCTNIRCPHFVADAVEYDMSRIRADVPDRWDNTARCPDCNRRFTVTLKRGVHTEHEYASGDAESGGIVGDVLCEQCEPDGLD